MPDTKTLTQPEANISDEELVQLTIRMPRDLNVRAKIAVAPLRGLTLNQLAIEGIERGVADIERGKRKQ